MEFGIDTWIGYPALDLPSILQLVENSGFRYIEYAFEHFRELEYSGRIDELNEYIEYIADAASTTRLKPLQIHAPYGRVAKMMGSTDENERKKGIEILSRWIRYAALLQVPIIVVHVARAKPYPGKSYKQFIEVLYKRNIESFKKLVKVCKNYGVKIAVENRLERWFGVAPEDLVSLINDVDPDYLGICLDTGHAHVNEYDIPEIVKNIKEHLIATHIHDNDGTRDQHYPPLMGSIKWTAVLKAFKEIGYPYPLILEIAGGTTIQQVKNKIHLTRIITEKLLSEDI